MSLTRVKLLEPFQNDHKPVVTNGIPLLDEVFFKNVDLHIEQMSTDGYWLGVTDAQSRQWHFWIGLNAEPTPSVELSCTDHPGKENGEPFPPSAFTSQPHFPDDTPATQPAQASKPWSYHPDTDSYYWAGYSIKPYMGELKELCRPDGSRVTQSKYLDYLTSEAQKDRAAPKHTT